jgi:hypothetical protein
VEPAGRGAEAQGTHPPLRTRLLVVLVCACHFVIFVFLLLLVLYKERGVSLLLADRVAFEIADGGGACLGRYEEDTF